MLRIRLAKRGRDAFAIVVAEKSCKRDGKFIEKVGYHQPTLKKEDPFRLNINGERFAYWVSQGAQPSTKIQRLAAKLGLCEAPSYNQGTKKSQPKAKAVERAQNKAN